MRRKTIWITSILGLLFLVVLATSTNLKGIKNEKRRENTRFSKTKIEPEKQFPLFKPKYSSLEEQLNHGKFLDRLTKTPPFSSIDEKIEEEEKENKNRQLEQNIFENVGFYQFKQANNSKAYKYLFNNLRTSNSKSVLYPYSFSYNEGSSSSNGGVFTLEPETLPKDIEKIKNILKVELGRAKAVYDMHVAIFKIEVEVASGKSDLFADSDEWCNVFTSYLGKVPSCNLGREELDMYMDSFPNKGGVMFIDHTELNEKKALFKEDGSNLINVLIVPDYVSESDDTILNKFGTAGIDNIKKFVNQGGRILASGKGGYLLEKMGIVGAGSYDPTHLVYSKQTDSSALIKGCEGLTSTPGETQFDFYEHLLCLSSPEKVYVSSTLKMVKHDGLQVLLKLKKESGLGYLTTDGFPVELSGDETDDSFPVVLFKEMGKGEIFIINANPLKDTNLIDLPFNLILSTFSKNVIFNNFFKFYSTDGEELPIPGGEGGILLNSVSEFRNIYDVPVTGFKLYLYFPINVTISNYDDTYCAMKSDSASPLGIEIPPVENMIMTEHLECSKTILSSYESFKLNFKLEILDQGVTQKMTEIPLMYPIVKYIDSHNQLQIIDDGPALVNAKLAAVLRGTLNPDPSSFYPLPGRGAFADTVLNVENKENTLAKDVDFISVIPLITPVVDGIDQAMIIEMAEVYDKYYEKLNDKHDFKFPWHSTGDDTDIVDYLELQNKDIILVAEWDTPTKIVKRARYEYYSIEGDDDPFIDLAKKSLGDELDMKNSLITDSTAFVLHQMYFDKADLFYEHATQRTMAFIDCTKKNGSAAQYWNATYQMDPTWKDADDPSVCKIDFGWSRLDIFFFSAQEYQNPTNLNENWLLSADLYSEAHLSQSMSNKTVLGGVSCGIAEPGYFDSSKVPKLKPDEFDNLLKQYPFHKQRNPLTEAGMNEIKQQTGDNSIILSHYIVPVKRDGLERAGNIRYFHENPDLTGYLIEYPSVKFIFGHRIAFQVAPEISRQGGKLSLHLPENAALPDDCIDKHFVQVSADQVAFYDISYDKNTRIVTLPFKRGLMPNEAYGKPSKLEIYLEGINLKSDFDVTIVLEEMKYDLSNKDNKFETYKVVPEKDFGRGYTAKYDKFWSLPCLIVHNHLERGEKDSKTHTSMREYELMNPYAHYGIYFQELLKHRTIWASPEAHHVSNPGLQAINGGFAVISNVGISSIPFQEYVTHGGLLIPGAIETSRIEWTDIWGRTWRQPLRSLFPDIPPIPPPLRNFMMSTTFELLTPDGKKRFLTWPSEEEAVIRVQMKFLNNYPKYFLSTTCMQNRITSVESRKCNFDRDRVFSPTLIDYKTNIYQGKDDYDLFFGHSSVYGKCFTGTGSILSGTVIDSRLSSRMDYAMQCSATEDPTTIAACAKELEKEGNPTLKRRKESDPEGKKWNYSPAVEKYYPKDYIKDNMWDLTHYDYDDNAMDKAYKYHMDNNLPGIDVGPPQNPAYTKPHNVVAFPIFKGLGYSITYDSTFTIDKFKPYHGWWSDNLQNKDNTLLAGNAKSNDVSVGPNKDLLKPTDWINAKDLVNPEKPNLVKNRLKNIYVCLFNQHRVKMNQDQPVYAWLSNVNQNNVIPIINELDENDTAYTNYDCTGKYQYDPVNISDVDNLIETSTDRDWLYFGINLRGGARETINVLMQLKPFADRKYEGITKVQDGGRFTYWNPANGPNSFLIVDDVVNTVEAYRVDLEVFSQFYPGIIQTFNAISYQVHTVQDTEEIDRQYNMTTYMNSYGFGDAAVTVYVGGTQDTNCKLEEGEETIVKISFYNNAGFDWNLREDAIDFNILREQAINGKDLLDGTVHEIKQPLNYKFLTLEFADDTYNVSKYVEIKPSDHNIDVAPQFFDFEGINVMTIRDGFEGDYFYSIKILPGFPEQERGRFVELKVKVNEEYFDRLPLHNDPTEPGYHDYHIQVPPIKFAVPYKAGHEYAGKVFYTLGRATDLLLSFKINKYFEVQAAKFATDDQINDLSEKSVGSDLTEIDANLKTWFDGISSKEVKYKVTDIENDKKNKLVTIFLNETYKTFPLERKEEALPDLTRIHVVTKTFSTQCETGYQGILSGAMASFTKPEGGNKENKVKEPSMRYVTAQGVWLQVTSNKQFVDFTDGKINVKKDIIFEADSEGYVVLNLTAINTGNAAGYKVKFDVDLAEGIEYIKPILPSDLSSTKNNNIITFSGLKESIGKGDKIAISILLKYNPEKTLRSLKSATSYSRTLINKIDASLAIEANSEDRVKQEIDSINLSSKTSDKTTVDLLIEPQGSFTSPKYTIKAYPDPLEPKYNLYRYTFARKTSIGGAESAWTVIAKLSESNKIDDSPLNEAQIGEAKTYKVFYKVELHDEIEGNDVFLAYYTVSVTETKTNNPDGENSVVAPVVDEKDDKDKSFPTWGIIVIAAGCLVLTAAIIFGIFKLKGSSSAAVAAPQVPVELKGGEIIYDRRAPVTTGRSDVQILKKDELKVIKFEPGATGGAL